MNFEIYVDLDNDSTSLTLELPYEYSETNEELYMKLTTNPFYVEKGTKLKTEKIKECLNEIENIYFKEFYRGSEYSQKIEYNFVILTNDKIDKIIEFLNNNKNLNLTLNLNEYDKIIKKINPNEFQNLKVAFKYSNKPIPYKEFYDMYKYLMEIIKFVDYYELSPLEKVLLIYDIVKSNIYNEENEYEDSGISRNLNEIIKGDKIVCVGFSNMFDFLLSQMNIKSSLVKIDYTNSERGHQKNLIYLEDEKYKIYNVFLLDPTWDSKQNENYLDSYKHFLRPVYYRINYKNEVLSSPQFLNILLEKEENLIKIIEKNNFIDTSKLTLQLNSLLSFCGLKKLQLTTKLNKENLINILKELRKRYFRTLPNENFANALYKVRRIEYINKIYKNTLKEKNIYNVANRFFKKTPEEKLLQAIFEENSNLNRALKESNAESIHQDILRMRFLKALKERINDFPQNAQIKKM